MVSRWTSGNGFGIICDIDCSEQNGGCLCGSLGLSHHNNIFLSQGHMLGLCQVSTHFYRGLLKTLQGNMEVNPKA